MVGGGEHLRQAFEYFDKNNSGYIEFEELRQVLFPDDFDTKSEQVIREILFDADLDKVKCYDTYNALHSKVYITPSKYIYTQF